MQNVSRGKFEIKQILQILDLRQFDKNATIYCLFLPSLSLLKVSNPRFSWTSQEIGCFVTGQLMMAWIFHISWFLVSRKVSELIMASH